MKDSVEYRGRCAPGKCLFTSSHFVEREAEREKIAASVKSFAERLLRRHIGNGSQSCARASEIWIIEGCVDRGRGGH